VHITTAHGHVAATKSRVGQVAGTKSQLATYRTNFIRFHFARHVAGTKCPQNSCFTVLNDFEKRHHKRGDVSLQYVRHFPLSE